MEKTHDNVMYFGLLNAIGGVETYYYYISKLYDDDIVIYVKQGDYNQLTRLRKRVPVKIWKGERIVCKRLFVNFNTDIIPYVDCKEIYFTAHGNYEDMINRRQLDRQAVLDLANTQKITKFLGVSKAVCEAWERVTGKPMELVYNPVCLDEPKKLLRLCCAQRFTQEKGQGRVEKLYRAFENYCENTGNKFEFTIYTNSPFSLGKNCKFSEPDLDANRFFGEYDYYLSLTDEEGYGYSVVEALSRGTPIIATPCKVFKELGLDESNTIFLDFDCSNADEVVEKAFNNKFKFKYEPPKSNLGDFFIKGKRDYHGEEKMKVICIQEFWDLDFKKYRHINDVWEVSQGRFEVLDKMKLVRVIEEVEDGTREEEVKRTTKKTTRKTK